MSELKCPFCGSEFDTMCDDALNTIFQCLNRDCKHTAHKVDGFVGNEYIWRELAKTRQQLKLAISFTNEITKTVVQDVDNPFVIMRHLKTIAQTVLDTIKELDNKKDE